MRPNRTQIASDNIGRICGCAHCIAAGVDKEPMRRIPGPGGKPIWIHAERLRDWLKAYREARDAFQRLGQPKAMGKR